LQALPEASNIDGRQISESSQSILLKLVIEGDLRFISHRDTMRMLSRALVRADLPVTYSQGFNPHLKLSLPLPRSVGMSSEDDPVFFQLRTELSGEEIADRLRPQLPYGASLAEVVLLASGDRPQLRGVSYEIDLLGMESPDLAQRLENLLKARSLVIDRLNHLGEPKGQMDIRPFVHDLELQDGLLKMDLLFHQGRSAAPREVLQALELPWNQLRHRIDRKKVEWK